MTYDFKSYDVVFWEEYVEIKIKKTKLILYIPIIICCSILIIPLLTFSILFFIKKDGYFYAISDEFISYTQKTHNTDRKR